MSDEPSIREEDLSPEAVRALETVVAADVAAVAGALATTPPRGVVYALCLLYSPDEDEFLDPVAVYVGLEEERAALLADKPLARVFDRIWNPEEYTGGDLEPSPSPREAAGFEEAEAIVLAELERLRVEDRARWVLDRVARRLGTTDLGIERTRDFVAFPLDSQFDEALLASLWFSAPPEAANALQKRGLLPATYEALVRMRQESR